MNNATITVAEVKTTGEWTSLKTTDGKEYWTKLQEPKIKAQIDAAAGKTPFELKGRIVDSKGKLFFWDEKEQKRGGGGFKGQPRDEGAIIAQSCISSACTLYAEKAGSSSAKADEVLATAEKFFQFVMTKSTLKKTVTT